MTYRHFTDIKTAERYLANTDDYMIFQKLLETKETQVIHSTEIEPMYECETQFEELYSLVILQILPDRSVRYYSGDDFTIVKIDKDVRNTFEYFEKAYLSGPRSTKRIERLLNNPKENNQYTSSLFHALLLDTKKVMFNSLKDVTFVFGEYYFDNDKVADIAMKRHKDNKVEIHVHFCFRELFQI